MGGKKVEIKNNAKGSTIHYTVDGKNDPTANSGAVYKEGTPITDTWKTMGVRAIATKDGKSSTVTRKTVSIAATTATPVLTQTDMAGGAKISLDASGAGETIYYTTDGSTPAFDVASQKATGVKYTGAFTLTSNATVRAIAVRSGQLASGLMTKDVQVTPPETPANLATASGTRKTDKIAVDDAVTVSWGEVSSAASYTATLYDAEGEEVESSSVKAAQVVFTPSKAGKYSVGVKAVNAIGASEESERVEFEAMAPCLVNFVDKIDNGDGTTTTKILDKQLVRYGYSAETPAVPKKKGYTFAGWSKDTPLTNITEPGYEIVSVWQIDTYNVRFLKDDGKTVITSRTVEFGSKATPPEPPAPETGYVFSGWTIVDANEDSDRDLDHVDSNMSVKAVYAWGDEELPVVVTINSAQRNERVYTVDVDVKNNPTNATTAILRVALKTSAGKLVQSSRETISLEAAGATKNHKVQLKYDEGGYVATTAEVEVVGFAGDNRTGGAYSKAVKATITSSDSYTPAATASEWTTEKLDESADYLIEEATQYRYRDQQTTTSTATSMSGWTRDDSKTKTTYGSWVSKPATTSKPTTSDTLRITSSPTKYNYYHYCNKYSGTVGGWGQDSGAYGSASYKHTCSTSSPLPAYSGFQDKGGKGSQTKKGDKCSFGYTPWWLASTVTTYNYQVRSKTITYTYNKWGDWSDWAEDVVEASGTRQVETRTVYRTRAKIYNDLTGTEDTSGEKHSVSGKFDSSLQVAGKEATIMVYNVTNSDPNEDQIQYIGQTTIGDDGSYAFDFIPKKEPSAETGDFIVSLGVKGATGLVNVGKIDAPTAEHKVVYIYKNAEGEDVTVSEQTVAHGESAEVPDPPAVEGSEFQRWSESTSSVETDKTVTALYTQATYAVAWVDWVNGGVFLETKAYGEKLAAPVDDPTANGYTFKGWDALINGNDTVKGNTVVNAVYDPIMYDVVFADAAGKVFAKQQVAYGQAANPPAEGPEAEGYVFVSWDTSAGTPWWNVTEDMIVRPKYAYEETASSPEPTVEIDEGFAGRFGRQIFLGSATEGAKIFYTTTKKGAEPASAPLKAASFGGISVQEYEGEEEEPEVEWFEYDPEQGITITEPTTITAVAAASGMNDSTEAVIDVNVTATNDISNADIGVGDTVFYMGEPVEPGIMVWLGDDLLNLDEDYTVAYSNNDAVGTGHALVKGVGNYTGEAAVDFEIGNAPGDDPGELASQSITASDKSVAMGKTVSLGAKASDNGVLSYSTSNASVATVSASGVVTPKRVGTATITIKAAATSSYAAATKTVTVTVTKGASSVAIAKQSKVYTGGALAYSGNVSKSGSTGKVTYSYYSDPACTKAASVKNAGNYYVRANLEADANWTAATSAAALFTVEKAANPLKVKAVQKTAKRSKVKRAAQTLTPLSVSKAQGKKTITVSKWKTASAKKYIKVNKSTGKVTVKKGTPKGAYKFQVKVRAAGNSNYAAGSKTVNITIRVK